jgi:lipopolysaccharide biosynthesis regulator YciM
MFSYETFLAMYYKKITADALTEKDLNKSFLYTNKAYQFDNENIAVINLLAVIQRRSGDLKTAEAIYKAGLNKGEDSIALLSNYITQVSTAYRRSKYSSK